MKLRKIIWFSIIFLSVFCVSCSENTYSGSKEVAGIGFINSVDEYVKEIYPIYGDPKENNTKRFLVRLMDGSVWFYEVTFSPFGELDQNSLSKGMIFPPIGE